MKKKVIEIIRLIWIVLLIILMIVSSISITYGKLLIKDYSNYLIIMGIIGLIIYIIDKIKNFKFNKYEIFIFILIILSSISLFSAIDINISLFGKVNRNEGLLVIITYYILLLNSMHIKNIKYLKIIIGFIITNYILNLIYGMYQVHMLSQPRYFIVKGVWKYARGLLGNSMFFGTLSTLCFSLILGLFIKEEIIYKKILLYLLLLMISLGSIISGSMGSIVAIIVIFIFVLFQNIIKIKGNKNNIYSIISLIFVIISFISIYIFNLENNRFLKRDLNEFKSEYISINKGEIKDNFGTGRVYIWKNTINKIIEKRGIGVGIDNFALAFDNKLRDVKSGLVVDKAHNEYLQKMLCEGVLSGIVYIVFLGSIFFKFIKKDLSNIYYGLYLAFISYSIQAFFSISVTRVAPVYFIITGLLLGNFIIDNKKNT